MDMFSVSATERIYHTRGRVRTGYGESVQKLVMNVLLVRRSFVSILRS